MNPRGVSGGSWEHSLAFSQGWRDLSCAVKKKKIDVRHRRDTAAPPFGSRSAWIVLVFGASRYMAAILSGGACLILGRSRQTLAISL